MSSKLRVLQVVDGLWVGGTERSLVEILPHFEGHGIEVRIACLRRRREGVEDRVPADRLLHVPGERLPGQVRALRRLLRRDRPALVHSSLFRANLVTRLAASGTGVPVLNSLVNDSYGPERFADPRLSAWRLRIVQGLDVLTGSLLADHFHAVSRSVAEAASRHLAIPEQRITIVRRGRDPERLGEPSKERRGAARVALGLEDQAEVVVSVGREEYQKGQDVLLDACARLTPRRPHLHVLLAGRAGSLTPGIEERLGRLPHRERVLRLGHREDIPLLLAAADLFAFPSRFEGLPGALLEAQALGLPIVASDIPSVREVVPSSEHGLLVPPDDPAALATAVEHLLDDQATTAAMGRRNRALFLERHTLARSVRSMADLYRRLARTPG